MSEELGRSAGDLKWFEMSKAIEDLMIREKKINAIPDWQNALRPDLWAKAAS